MHSIHETTDGWEETNCSLVTNYFMTHQNAITEDSTVTKSFWKNCKTAQRDAFSCHSTIGIPRYFNVLVEVLMRVLY